MRQAIDPRPWQQPPLRFDVPTNTVLAVSALLPAVLRLSKSSALPEKAKKKVPILIRCNKAASCLDASICSIVNRVLLDGANSERTNLGGFESRPGGFKGFCAGLSSPRNAGQRTPSLRRSCCSLSGACQQGERPPFVWDARLAACLPCLTCIQSTIWVAVFTQSQLYRQQPRTAW